ncbi:MAG: hypothetical protein CL429_04745 [Acidimicrobiaceae bacterium]|nr:hypothetical protein [Acidimicrobiaceae bacterium]|tara:strand:+ start:1001 stop:1603 length:603 start_codon:yes stop_codon:yes gene_type:complete
MAKKKLILNEGVTRRFMKLASVKPAYVSNFLNEAEEDMMDDEAENEDMPPVGDGAAELAPAEEPMEMEMEPAEEPDQSAAAEGMIMDLMAKIQEFAEEQGVSVSVEGDEPAGDDSDMMDDAALEDPEMEMDAELAGGDTEETDEEPEMGMEDAEANRMYEETEKDLDAAGVEVVDEEKIVAEVTRRVARRLLRESAKSRK